MSYGKNAYHCPQCRQYVVTIDRDIGVTPMFLACRVLGDPSEPDNVCKGSMRSMMYPEEPWPVMDGFGVIIPTEPTWEWYKPDDEEFAGLDDEGTREHVSNGGLLLRPISEVTHG